MPWGAAIQAQRHKEWCDRPLGLSDVALYGAQKVAKTKQAAPD